MIENLISFNVNGVRAAAKKGLLPFLQERNAEVVCFQEIKALPSDLEPELLNPMDYKSYWNPAEKKGYSGVAVYSKREPLHVEYGLGMEKYDVEGRAIRLDFPEYSVLNVYIPSGSSGEERQGFKEEFLADFAPYVADLRKKLPKLVICGDFNICHKPIDIHNPVSNKDSSGFLPHEREWVSQFLEIGFVDTFRQFTDEGGHYTWWTYRAGAYGNNKGWRIDYHMATDALAPHCRNHIIHKEIRQSDHAPIELQMEF